MKRERVCNRITPLYIDLSTKKGHSHLTLGRWTGQTRYLKLDADDSVRPCLPRLAGAGEIFTIPPCELRQIKSTTEG